MVINVYRHCCLNKDFSSYHAGFILPPQHFTTACTTWNHTTKTELYSGSHQDKQHRQLLQMKNLKFLSFNIWSGREYWMIYRGQGFPAVLVWFGSYPTPHFPPLPSVRSTGDTQKDWERETTYSQERGEGVLDEPNHTGSLVFYKSINTLW